MIGEVRNYSDEIQDEAYLFIPFDEVYYQAMAKVIDAEFANWHGQRFDEKTFEPSRSFSVARRVARLRMHLFPVDG